MPAFVIFEAAGRSFAMPASRVLQVLRAAAPAALPDAPEIVRGALDVHGELFPVLDVRVELGSRPAPVRASDQLVLVDAMPRIALLVDRVLDVRDVAPAQVDRGEAWRAGSRLAEAAIRLPDGAVVVHSADRWAALARSLGQGRTR